MSNDPFKEPLYISRLNVELFREAQKDVKSVKLLIRNKLFKEIDANIAPGGVHKETFIPALELQPGDPISVLVQYREDYQNKVQKTSMSHREILSGVEEKAGVRMYQKTEEKSEMTISLRLLRLIPSDVIKSCSRFRVLVIGNSGVGKTLLTNKVFEVNEICVSDDTRGIANIEQELISQNKPYIVHDSEGFEEGDSDGVDMVRQFAQKYSDQQHVQNRLHAVWLCLEIPYAGGRLLERGVEKFLRQRREVLGDVPLVVVLTKVDLIENQMIIDEMEGYSYGKTCEQRKSEIMDEHCFRPLRRAAGEVPYAIVSATAPNPAMFDNLMEVTQKCINTYVGE